MSVQNPVPISTLASRLSHVRIDGDPSVMVCGVSHDSRRARLGDLFVCLEGASFDGHRYAAQALNAGAAALLVNEGGFERAGVEAPASRTVVTVPDTRKALPFVACALCGDPSHSMTVVGVTGTNGKTTTTRMVASILRAAGVHVGTIGTLGAELDGRAIPSDHTTPEADQLQSLLARMRDDGASAVVMEVSSHALAQHRTDGIAFSAAVFTNLTQDHLDFHGTMDAYFSTKAKLFADYPERFPRPDGQEFVAAINVTSWHGQYLSKMTQGEVITYALDGKPATLRAEAVSAEPERTQFEAVYEAGSDEFRIPIALPVGGAFQVGNALGAAAVCLGLGVSWDRIAAGLQTLAAVPGRFEAVPVGQRGFSVVVDYAHTPDGLENLLKSARDLGPTRVLLVFGCGGDRDRAKRPIMGRLAATLADYAVVTSDNPRSEQPRAIIEEIIAGMDCGDAQRATVEVEADRRKAIHLALSEARPGDIVLIAGKGHEDYQIVGSRSLPFDDRLVAREWLTQEAE